MNHDRPSRRHQNRGEIHSGGLTAQLVFFQVHGTSVTLDTLVTETSGRLPELTSVGVPVALEVGVPGPGWARAALAALERWASDGRPLELSARQGADGPQLQISDGDTAMLLELL